MTAEMDVHGDISEVKEKCGLDMSTYEDLPTGCNAAPHDYVTATPKDDADGSYVFVSSTDAATNEFHVGSDLNGQGECAQNAGMEITVEVQNGESSIEDGRKPESFLVDVHISDALDASQVNISNQVKESDAVQDDIRLADVLQSSDSQVNEAELGLDSSPKVDDTRIQEDHGIAATNDSFGTEANPGEVFEVLSPQKVEDIQILKENQIIAVSESFNTDANLGEEIEVDSSQMADNNQTPDDYGIVEIVKASDTGGNHEVEVEAESSQKADDIQSQKENGTVAIIEFSDTEANPGVEIEVESSQETENILINEESGIVAIINSSETEANPREESEVESCREVEDIEIQGQNEIVATIESSSTREKCGEEIEVKSSQKVEDIQIAEYNGVVAISEPTDTIDNHCEEIEEASFERVEDVQESQDANLEVAACNFVNGREKIDEKKNKSELNEPAEETGKFQITVMSSAKSELDQPDDSVESIKGECTGLALNVENSGTTQVTISKDGGNNRVVGEEQTGSSNEVPLLEPSGDYKVDMEQNLAAAPCSLVILKLETENQNGPISLSNEDGLPSMDQDSPLDIDNDKDTVSNKISSHGDGLPTSMDQDSPSGTNDDEDTEARKISSHDDPKTSPASVYCEVATIDTCKISPSELVNDPKIELIEVAMDEPNHVLELEEGSETASCPIVDDECIKVEVSEGTVSENGDDKPTAPDESRIHAVDSVSGSQLIPEGNETTVSSVMIGNARVEIRKSFSTLCLNDPVLKPDLEVEDYTKSEDVASTVDDIQPDKQVSENHDVCLLANTDLKTKFENGHTEKDNQSISPSNDMRSESILCISIGCEEKDSTVSEVPNGVYESSASQPNSVDVDSELHDNESSSVLCSAGKKKSGDDVEITSSIGSRDIPGDDCIVSEPEVLKHSLVNNEGDLNTMSDIVVTKIDTPTKGETEANHESCQDEPLSISPEGSAVDALEGQNVGTEVGTRPFYFLIRVPRYDDDNIREQIKCAQLEVDRKTQDRDAIRVQIQTMRASWKVVSDNLEAAMSEERAARDMLKSKRQEIDSVQSLITKVKNAMSVEDIDGRIRNIEHMIEHETLPLKEEKQLIREIKQLKQLREQLSLTVGKQDELQQALDQKEQIEERLKLLRKEVEVLRDNVLKAESVTKTAKKKFNDENVKLDELQSQFKAADKIRQEAYANLQGMRKQLYEKSKYFWKYRDDVKEANDLASSGDRERLQHLCVNQVETMMELWNKNHEFRRDYIRCNMRSTLRRLRTLDGRSLGPNEEPPVLTNTAKERSARDNPLSIVSKQEREKLVPAETVKDKDKPVIKIVETKNQTTKNKKPDVVPLVDSHTKISGENEVDEAREEKIKRTKEEEELAAKAEELRKEEEAVRLMEQRKLEEKAKAKEALERKKRNAERTQARAVIKARKEAEEREKQREKRAKKKEKKMAAAREAIKSLDERETAETTEAPTEAPKETEDTGKQATVTKRSRKLSLYTKQSKAKVIPPPLRNRGKRRMQPWMWVLLTAMVVLVLFFVGQQRLLY